MSDWQPIETAPKPTPEQRKSGDEPWLLVYEPPKPIADWRPGAMTDYRICVASMSGDEGDYWTGSPWDSEMIRPTHWMPLPAPPKT